MDANDYQIIRQLFDDYLQMYSSRDDRLTTYFSEDFSGITGSGDFLAKDREEWDSITRQDFAQAKDPIRIELKDLTIQSLVETIAVATSALTIHFPSIGEAYGLNQTDPVAQSDGEHTGGSILVMDDEEIIRKMTTEILGYLGYQATACENGAEAIARYKAAMESGSPISAVIMDLTIPGGMGGKEAAEQILAIDPTACLIVSSGYSNDPIMSDYAAYGFSGAITKPYNMTEFEQLLSSTLSAR